MSNTIEEYPVVHYNPLHYIPLSVFKNQWVNAKEESAELADDPYAYNPHAGSFSAMLYSSAPFILLVTIAIILLNAMVVRSAHPDASLGAYLGSPSMIIALTAFTMSLVSIYRKSRFVKKLKNSVDYAVLESARLYLLQRYGFLPENWTGRFIGYLTGENIPDNRFSEKYQLTVKNYKGYHVFMVTNVNGEAPVKY